MLLHLAFDVYTASRRVCACVYVCGGGGTVHPGLDIGPHVYVGWVRQPTDSHLVVVLSSPPRIAGKSLFITRQLGKLIALYTASYVEGIMIND